MKPLMKTLFNHFLTFVTGLFLFTYTLNAQCPDSLWQFCEIDPGIESKVNITNGGYWKVITSNGIPNHTIGIFPLGGIDCGRPTALREQNYTFVIPAYSSKGKLWPGRVFDIPKPPFMDKPETVFGVAVNGVPFDPVAAEWWETATNEVVDTVTDWNLNPMRNEKMEADLDCNYGHVQPDGGYHYHGYPYGLYDKIKLEQETAEDNLGNPDHETRKRSQIVLLGWAFDGNPIYGEHCGLDNSKTELINARSSYKLLKTPSAGRPSTSIFPMGDFVEDFWYDQSLFDSNRSVRLDQCNGHTGPTPEFPHGVYHYHILEKTDSLADIGFPYIGRCYRLFTYGQGPNIFPKTRR